MKTSGYMDRALKARDPRFARILGRLGYARRDIVAEEASAPAPEPDPLDHDGDGAKGGSKPADERGDDLEAVRAEYEAATGEPADRRWGISRIRKALGKLGD